MKVVVVEVYRFQICVKHKMFLHMFNACCSVVVYVNRDGITYEQGHKMSLRLFEAQYNSVRITLFIVHSNTLLQNIIVFRMGKLLMQEILIKTN